MVRLRGSKELIGKLKRNANLNDVKQVVVMNTTEMHRKAQRNAPVDSGNLKRNIRYYQENGGFTGKVASEAEYAPYQEYGTRFQAGTPHVRPAFHKQKSKFINDMKRLMK